MTNRKLDRQTHEICRLQRSLQGEEMGKRSIAAALSAIAVFAGMALAAVAPASAATIDLIGYPDCNPYATSAASTPLCLNDDLGHIASGTPIDMRNWANVAAQDVTWPQLAADCGNSVVTSTCPFNNPNWDNNYKGREIVYIELPNVGTRGDSCVGTVDNNTEAALEPCGSATTAWVIGPSVADVLYNFINVNASNASGVSGVQVLLAANGSGSRATLRTYNAGTLELWGSCVIEACFAML